MPLLQLKTTKKSNTSLKVNYEYTSMVDYWKPFPSDFYINMTNDKRKHYQIFCESMEKVNHENTRKFTKQNSPFLITSIVSHFVFLLRNAKR